jgi:two-component sensor histidine kinase
VRVKGVRLSLDQALPCGLILNELVTNALKHGFRKRAAAVVNASRPRGNPPGGTSAVGVIGERESR